MKVAFTLHHRYNLNAGACGAVGAVRDAMEQAGVQTRFFTVDDMSNRYGKMAGPSFPWWCAKQIPDGAFDVLDASTGDAWIWAALRPRRRTLLVTHSHGLEHVMHDALMAEVRAGRNRVSWKYPLYHGGYRLYEVARSLRAADLCLFLNDADREYAISRLQVPADRARVLPNGCDEVLLSRESDIRPATRGTALVQIGSYIPRKGVATTAAAMSRLLRTHETVRLHFAGTGCPPEVVLADYAPDLRNRITVTPSFRRAELPDLVGHGQILLFPSYSEGFPLSLVEGMACGLVPVSAHIPGPDQVIVEDVNGLYFPAGDADALHARLEELLADPDRLYRLRQGAVARAREFRWSQIARRRISLYEEFMERKRSAASH